MEGWGCGGGGGAGGGGVRWGIWGPGGGGGVSAGREKDVGGGLGGGLGLGLGFVGRLTSRRLGRGCWRSSGNGEEEGRKGWWVGGELGLRK